ncbi:MAG: hypothetical protein MUF46_04510 [Desulfobacterales bacterium]|jgi:hypothetical protein|nr:hypothetical protein [Desulfobacterales bacterium]MCU0584902.1 hypothetical protein [Desulfobacterales bacterium]
MATPDETSREAERVSPEIVVIPDNGGTRSGIDRRQKEVPFEGTERRSGPERRKVPDRRAGIDRRRSEERRSERFFWDGRKVERRDAFRKRSES